MRNKVLGCGGIFLRGWGFGEVIKKRKKSEIS